jgi:hypothetical protein
VNQILIDLVILAVRFSVGTEHLDTGHSALNSVINIGMLRRGPPVTTHHRFRPLSSSQSVSEIVQATLPVGLWRKGKPPEFDASLAESQLRFTPAWTSLPCGPGLSASPTLVAPASVFNTTAIRVLRDFLVHSHSAHTKVTVTSHV